MATHYVWEGGQVIAEYEFGGGNTSGAGVRYYEPDRLSTRVITNGSGAVVGTLDQLPFGEEAGAAGESEKHKFTSYERDSETGTDYAVNRQYQNALGRFMRPDPYGGSMSIGNPQSFNRYAYVGNDPINSVDPLGLQQDPPLVIDVEDPPPAPQQPIESNDTLVVNTNEPGFFFFFPGFIDRPLLAFVRIDIVIGGLVDAGSDGFFTPPVPLVPEPPAAPPQQEPTLGPCNLVTPGFDELAEVGLLSGPFDDDPRALYNSLSTYNQAVLLNTSAALSNAGVNLGNANFFGFYRGGNPGNAAFGVEVTGVGTGDLGNLTRVPGFGYRSPREVKIGSVEATFEKGGVVGFDVDLYNPKSNIMKHLGEVSYNSSHNSTTHPGDVARQLAARGVNSGVGCQ